MQALEHIGTRRNFNTVKQKVTVEKHANKFLLENPCNGKTRFDDPLEDDISCDILGTFTDYVQKHTKVKKFNPCDQYVSVFKNMLGTKFPNKVQEWGEYYSTLRCDAIFNSILMQFQ